MKITKYFHELNGRRHVENMGGNKWYWTGEKQVRGRADIRLLISTKRRVSADAHTNASTRKETVGRRVRRKVKISKE
jgi:hypothetical protein